LILFFRRKSHYCEVKDPGWVNLLLLRSGRANLLWVWKISPKNPIFSIFSFRVKKSHQVGSKNTRVKEGSGSYLLQVKSVLGSVWVGSQGPSLLLCSLISLKLKEYSFWNLQETGYLLSNLVLNGEEKYSFNYKKIIFVFFKDFLFSKFAHCSMP